MTPLTNRQALIDTVRGVSIQAGFSKAYDQRGMDVSINKARTAAFTAIGSNDNPEAEILAGVLLYLLTRLDQPAKLEALFLIYETTRGASEVGEIAPEEKTQPKLFLV